MRIGAIQVTRKGICQAGTATVAKWRPFAVFTPRDLDHGNFSSLFEFLQFGMMFPYFGDRIPIDVTQNDGGQHGAGPLVRLRRSMRALARGEHVEPIKFREGDFWQEFAEEFNAVAARVQGERPQDEPTLREETATASESVPSDEPELSDEPQPSTTT